MVSRLGPQSDDAKAAMRLNAVTHGVRSESPVLPHVESEEEWMTHHEAIQASLSPEGAMEAALAERVALTLWRLRRLVRYEREQVRNRQSSIPSDLSLVAMMDHREITAEPTPADLKLIDRWLMDRLVPAANEINLVMRYETHLNRQLYQALHELEAMQLRRRGESAPLGRLDLNAASES